MPSLRRTMIFLPMLLWPGVLARATLANWDACSGRLERALDTLHRESNRRVRLEDEEGGMSYQQELRSAPLEMSVTRIAVKLPQTSRIPGGSWARVERCVYESAKSSLQTRVVFNDLAVSGMVSLMPRDRHAPIPAESCRMTLRLRRAGIEFFTSPIARGRGQMRIRTESSFLEPRFASIYAYGCHATRVEKQIKRQDKWPPHHPSSNDEVSVLPILASDNYEAAEPRKLVGVSKEVDVPIANESRQSQVPQASATSLGVWRKNFWVTKAPLRRRRSIDLGVRNSERPSDSPISKLYETTIPASDKHSSETKSKKNTTVAKNVASILSDSSTIRIHRTIIVENPRDFAFTLNSSAYKKHQRTIPLNREHSRLPKDTFGKKNIHSIVPRSSSIHRIRRTTEVITPQDFAMALVNNRSSNPGRLSNNDQFNETIDCRNETNILTPEQESDDCRTKLNVKRENGVQGESPRETRELFLDETFDNVFPDDHDEGSRSWHSKEHIAREMEDVFLRGASQALTRYIERQLHPAIKETLMLSMGYTVSYG